GAGRHSCRILVRTSPWRALELERFPIGLDPPCFGRAWPHRHQDKQRCGEKPFPAASRPYCALAGEGRPSTNFRALRNKPWMAGLRRPKHNRCAIAFILMPMGLARPPTSHRAFRSKSWMASGTSPGAPSPAKARICGHGDAAPAANSSEQRRWLQALRLLAGHGSPPLRWTLAVQTPKAAARRTPATAATARRAPAARPVMAVRRAARP